MYKIFIKKTIFVMFFMFWFFVANLSFANLSYGDHIKMELIWWDWGTWFWPLDSNTAKYFDEENYDAYSLMTAKNYIGMGDLVINADNSVQVTFLWWLWIHSTEYERILVEWNIIWNLSMDGVMDLQISGKSREFYLYQKTYWEWQEWLCTSYQSKWPVLVEWNFDKKIWIITMTLTNCDGAKYFFKSTEKVDLVSCEEGEVYLNEKCKLISDLCSDDNLVNYNISEEECYCPSWYRLTNEKTCEEVEEMLYEIKYLEQQPPFLLDGKEHKIWLSIRNWETWEPMAATKIAIKYTSAPKQWEIIEIQKLLLWEYVLTYKPAVIETGNMNGRIDGLYIFYNSKLEWKEVYKTYEIPLWTWIPIEISKDGFQDKVNTMVFSENTAQVKIVIKDNAWKKIPVYDAKIILPWEAWFVKTDKDGVAIIKSPEEVNTNIQSEVFEVILTPTKEIIERQNKALIQYKQIIQDADFLVSPRLKIFVEDFYSYLAQIEDNKIEDAVVGLKRVAYTLLYMTEWKKLIDDISNNVAISLKNQVADTLDLLGANEKMGKYIWQKIDEEIDIKKLQDLAPDINERLGSLSVLLQENVINTLKLWIQKYAPSFKNERTNDLLWVIFGTYWTNEISQKWINDIQKVSVGEIESTIKNYLIEGFDVMLVDKMKELENMIKNWNFSSSEFLDDISMSKLESFDLRDKYMTTHEVSYGVTMIKNYADLANNVVWETMKITQIYKRQAELAEKWYKAIRSLFLDTTEIYYRVDAYGELMADIESNINRGIWIAWFFNSEEMFMQKNMLSPVYASNIELTNEQKNQAYDYRGIESMIIIVDKLDEINNLLLLIYPEDKDLQIMSKNFHQTRFDEQRVLDDLGIQTKSNLAILLNTIDVNNNEMSDNILWLIVVLFLVSLFVLFVIFIKKRRKKNKMKKNNLN